MADTVEQRRPSPWIRLPLIGLGILLALLVLLYVLIRLGLFNGVIDAVLENALSDPKTRTVATVERLEGDPLSEMTIGRIVINARGKDTVVAEDIRLTWRHLGLLAGRVRVDELHARRLSLAQAPPGPEEPFPTELPSLPVDLRLERLKIDEVRFERSSTVFTLVGAGRWTTDPAVELRLAMVPSEASGEFVRLAVDYNPRKDRLVLDGRLASKAGGGLGDFLFPGEEGDVSLVLAGQGSVHDWHGRLDGRRGDTPIAALSIGVTDHLRIDGMLDPRPFLPKTATTALIGAPRIVFDAVLKDAVPDTYTASIANDGAEIRLSGSLADRAAIMSPRFAVASRNAAWFAPVLAGWTYGEFAASGQVTQTGKGPSVAADVSVSGLKGPDLAAARVTGALTLLAAATGKDGAPVYTVNGKGALEGVSAAERTMRADWELAADYDTAAGRIHVDRAALSDAGSRIAADGDVTLEPLSAKGSATVALADIGRWQPGGAAGRIDADGSFDWQPARGRLLVKAKGAAKSLRLPDARLSALLGPSPSFRVSLDDPAGPGQGDLDGAVDGAQVSASVKGRIGDTIDAAYQARFADVASLTGGGTLDTKGPLTVSGTLKGRTGSPDVTLEAAADAASLGGIPVTDLKLNVAAANVVDAATGKATASFGMDGEPVAVSLPFAVAGNGAWKADPVEVTSKSASISGGLSAESLGAPVTGELTLRLTSGRVLSLLAGTDVAGEIAGTVRLAAAGEAQGIRLDVGAKGLSVAMGGDGAATMAGARLQGDLVLGEALLINRLTLDGKDVVMDRAKLTTVAVAVTPSGGGLAFEADAKGDFQGPLSLSLRGRADRALLTAPNTITLESLNGVVSGQKIALAAPATAVLAEGSTHVGPVRLTYNGAPVEAEATLREDGASSARVSARELDLRTVSALTQGQQMSGKLSIDGNIEMSAVPRGHFSVKIAGLQVEDTLDRRPTDLAAEVTLGGNRVKGTLTVGASGNRTLDVAADLPVSRGSHGPFALAVDVDKPLDLVLKGNAELAQLWPLTGAYEHILGGKAIVDAHITGSVAHPSLNGAFSIASLTYRNLSTGIRVEAPQLRFTLKDNLLELPATAATDGAKGNMTLAGWIKPLAPGGMQADLTVQFTNAQVMKQRGMTARATGKIDYKQDKDGALIAGQATVNQAEYALNAKASDDIVKLYVVEINRPPGLIMLPDKPAAKAFKTRLKIDVTADNRVFVRGRGLDSEWRGQVRIRGTTDALALQGRIELVKGEFDFAGRKFVLQDGSHIELLGGTDIDPVITARAVYSVTSLTAEISLTGKASNPQIKLSSNPEMPQDEIISRVLFGEGKEKLSTFEAAQLAAAVASLSSSGSGLDVIGKLRGAFGLDRLTVGTREQVGRTDEEQSGSPVIRGGKYLTKKIYVEVGSATEEEDATSASVQIDLTKHLSVSTEATSTGNQKFKLQYKLDY